jgi:hypothetical protein
VKGRSAESTYLIESVGAFVLPTFSYADSIARKLFFPLLCKSRVCLRSVAPVRYFTLIAG